VDIPETVTSIANHSFWRCTSLRAVYYEGSTIMTTNYAFSSCSVSSVCVPPSYPSDSFCELKVTPKVPTCSTFRSLFNSCYKGYHTENGFVQEKKKSAIDWESQTNGCVEYKCVNDTGDVSWSLCNSSHAVVRLCLNDQCIEQRRKKGASVVFDVDKHKPATLNISSIVYTLANLTGLDEDTISVGYQLDDEGYIVSVIVYAEDDHDIDVIVEAVDSAEKEGENCKYGILCEAKNIRVIEIDDVSGAQSVHSCMLFGFVLALLLMLFKL